MSQTEFCEVAPGSPAAPFKEGDRVRVKDPKRYGVGPDEAIGVVLSYTGAWPPWSVRFTKDWPTRYAKSGAVIPKPSFVTRLPTEALERV